MKKIILLLILLSFIFSCQSGKDESSVGKEKIINDFNTKYNIKYEWDTLSYPYSIDYMSVIDSKYQLIDILVIDDFYEKDSVQYVSLHTGVSPIFYFDFPITNDQEQILFEDNDLILVASVSEIHKVKFPIYNEAHDENYDEENSDHIPASVSLNISSDFSGRGKIVDLKSISKN